MTGIPGNFGNINPLLQRGGVENIQEAEKKEGVEGAKITPPGLGGDSYALTDPEGPPDSPELDGVMDQPGVTGNVAGADSMVGRTAFLGEISDGALMFAALMEMAEQGQREMKDARQLKDAMHDGKIQSRDNAIDAEASKQEHERDAANDKATSAWVAFGVTLGVAAGGAVASGAGGNMVSTNEAGAAAGNSQASSAVSTGEGLQKAGSVATAVATNLGQAVSATMDANSKTSGSQRAADDKQLQQKRFEREEAIFDDSIDSAKSSYDEAKENFKLALRIMGEHFERNTQVAQKISNS